jgi:hypothetical protein
VIASRPRLQYRPLRKGLGLKGSRLIDGGAATETASEIQSEPPESKIATKEEFDMKCVSRTIQDFSGPNCTLCRSRWISAQTLKGTA